VTGWDGWFKRLRDLTLLAAGLRWGEATIREPGPADPWELALILFCLGFPVASWADERWRSWAERRQPPILSGRNGTEGSEAAERAVP
jgi:hypothetical protein